MKVEKLAKNREKGQNCYPLSPRQRRLPHAQPGSWRSIPSDNEICQNQAMSLETARPILVVMRGFLVDEVQVPI